MASAFWHIFSSSLLPLVRGFKQELLKQDQIYVLTEAKLNLVADRISIALNDDNISDDEFPLILSEVDKYNQIKLRFVGVRGRKISHCGVGETKR